MTEVSNDVLVLLHGLRMREHEHMSVSDYAKLYNFIVVDDVVYSTPEAQYRVKEYAEIEDRDFFSRSLPDVIIKNGVVIKNRYGLQNS